MSIKSARRLAKGLCASCYKSRGTNIRYCDSCLGSIRRSTAKLRQIERQEVLKRYGNICAFCGEGFIPFLTIDHINNDGHEHRTKFGNGLYAWLRRNNYPDGFQTLCFNCNCGKSKIGDIAVLQLLDEAGRLTETGRARLESLRCSDES